MGIFSFLRSHVSLNNDPQQEYIAVMLTVEDDIRSAFYGEARETARSNDEVAKEILAYMDSKGWAAAECINRISHANSLVFTQVGKGPKFDRSKDITNLCIAAIKSR